MNIVPVSKEAHLQHHTIARHQLFLQQFQKAFEKVRVDTAQMKGFGYGNN